MTSDRQRYALQVIFSFFLGLMVTAFIGVGVNTFFPPPETDYQRQLDDLYREQEDIEALYPGAGELTRQERRRFRDSRGYPDLEESGSKRSRPGRETRASS